MLTAAPFMREKSGNSRVLASAERGTQRRPPWNALGQRSNTEPQNGLRHSTCPNVDEPQQRDARGEEPDTKGHVIWFHLHATPRPGKSTETESSQWRPAAAATNVGMGVNAQWTGVSFWGDENVWNWMKVTVVQPCECIKRHWSVHFPSLFSENFTSIQKNHITKEFWHVSKMILITI